MKVHSVFFGFLAILFLAVAVYAAYYMNQLRFWANYPLFLMMGGWAGLLFLVLSLRTPNTQSMKWLFLSILSGCLLAKGFVYTSPLLFIGFVPLLCLQNQLEDLPQKVKYRTHAWYAFNAFMFWNIGASWWVANAALIPALVAFILNSFFMIIPWLGMIRFGRSFPKLKYLAFIAFWISFEWIHHAWEISWPWLTLGNGLAFMPKVIQWYDITGTFGGSIWILIVNILIAGIIIRKNYSAISMITIVASLLIPVVFGFYKYNNTIPHGESVEVGIVQPNYEPHYEKFRIDQKVQMVKFERLSHSIINQNTRFLIWPETSFEIIETDQFNSDWRIQKMKELIAGNSQLCLISGVTTLKTFREGEKLSDAVRTRKRIDQIQYFEIQNSAIQINSGDNEIPVYVKSKLVPGVETFPYRRLLPFLKPIVDMLDGTLQGLGKQKERSVFQHHTNKIAPVICYESIYGNYIGDYIRKGAQAIFIMTNDGWWDDTPGYKQHLAFGTLRAIEFRRPIARAANTGISCFVNARGDIITPTQYGKDAAISGNLLFSNTSTFYLATGDLLAYLCLYLTASFLCMGIFIFLKARFSKNR